MPLLDHRGRNIEARESGGNGFTRDDVAALYSTVTDLMEHAGLTSGLLDLAIDSVGWERLGGLSTGAMSAMNRKAIVSRSRLAAVYDPLSVQTLRIWRIFTNGRGIKVKAEDERAQVALDEFWNAPRNRSVFSIEGIDENVDTRNQDGELIFAVFIGDKFGGTTVRLLNSLEITGVVTSPDDLKMPLGYTREYTTKDNKPHKLFYWDMYTPEEIRTEAQSEIPTGFEEQEDVVVHFSKANSRWQRGNPLLTPALDWSKAFRKFMEARHAIQLAMSEFVKDHKLKGTAADVAAALSFHRSGLSTGGSGRMNNPPATPASTWAHNEGSELTTIKQETGASSAQTDGDMLLQMQGVGVGLPPHYYGSGKSAGNLSVATTMELPILKQFQAEQEVYRAIYNDLIQYEFEQVGISEDARGIEIDFPEIVIKDVPALMQGLAQATQVAPRLAGTEVVEMFILSAFGIQDPAAVIEKLNDEQPEPQAEEGQLAEVLRSTKTLREWAAELKESAAWQSQHLIPALRSS